MAHTHTHTHTFTHCKCIHGGLSSKVFLSLPLADREGRGSTGVCSSSAQGGVKVGTCIFLSLDFFNPPLLTVSMTKLY